MLYESPRAFARLLAAFQLHRELLLHLLDAVEHGFESVGEDQQVRVPENARVLEAAIRLAVRPLRVTEYTVRSPPLTSTLPSP